MKTITIVTETIRDLLFNFRSKKSTLLCAVNWIFLATGLYGSLKVVSGLFGIDSDTCHSLMLWHGVKEHGMVWISDWLFTQDNWLLSLVPFHFLGFSLFGPNASLVIIFGWFIFVFSALVSGAIAWSVGAKRASFFIVIALLNFGLYAHYPGLVSYSTSHNITNLFGLTSILILIRWSKRPDNLLLVLLLATLTSGAISDPWMLPSYNLPILLVGLVFLARPTNNIGRDKSLKLIALSSISIIAVKTKLFGTLAFLPSMRFSPADWLTTNTNSFYLVKDLGGLLNIIPFSGPNWFLPGLLSLAIIAVFLQHSTLVCIRTRTKISQAAAAYFLVSLFSIAGIISAFIISNLEADDGSARFLISCAYLVVITAGILADYIWENVGHIYRYSLILILGLFLSSSLISNFNCIASRNFQFRDNGTANTIALLNDNGLTYGYGPYWGSNANAVTAASQTEIRIRPVVFNRRSGMISGNRAESSTRWYTAEDIPTDVSEFFVIVKADGEECPDISICLDGLARQFGQPTRSIKNGDASILVWNRELLDCEKLSSTHPIKKFDSEPIVVVRNKKFKFTTNGEVPNGHGWGKPEGWGTWSEGNSSLIMLTMIDRTSSDVEMVIEGVAYLPEKDMAQRVGVVVNGLSLGQLTYNASTNGGLRAVKIPGSVIREGGGALNVEFSIDQPRSPLELGISVDPRKMGFGLISLSFR